MNKHEHGEDDEVQTSQGFGQSFVVPGEPPKAVRPTETAFDDPSTRQQHKAFFASGSLMTCSVGLPR